MHGTKMLHFLAVVLIVGLSVDLHEVNFPPGCGCNGNLALHRVLLSRFFLFFADFNVTVAVFHLVPIRAAEDIYN